MIEQEASRSTRGGDTPPRVEPRPPTRRADGDAPQFEPEGSAESRGTFESSPIGAYLMRQRRLRGVSIEELSTLTRIPLRSLQRLESGEFDGETDGFVRGFVRTVAIALGLDADDTIARMLQEPVVGGWERHQPSRRTKQWFAALVLLASAVLFVLFLQAGWRVLVGAGAAEVGREVIVWRDPVRSLAEATGAEVDPAGEIDPGRGTRDEVLPNLPNGAALSTVSRPGR